MRIRCSGADQRRLAGGRGGPDPPPFKPVVDTKLLMQSVVDPNADLVWDAVKTIDTANGTEEIRPKTDEQWSAVRYATITLTESGNLLMMAPRAKDGGEWMKRAQETIDAGEAAIKVAGCEERRAARYGRRRYLRGVLQLPSRLPRRHRQREQMRVTCATESLLRSAS